jgi:hypothetical protein
MVDTMIDHPEPQTFPRPDAVLAVESGQLRIPPRDGYLAQTNMRDDCPLCRIYLQHSHDGMEAVFPY